MPFSLRSEEIKPPYPTIFATQPFFSRYLDLSRNSTLLGLSDCELEVLQLVTQGMSNLEIGAALMVTETPSKPTSTAF
jgi:ATP/maltotriose-dependent transcriptional regulator MalT